MFKPQQKHLMMLGVTGSKAYGTATPASDTDIRGICIAPMRVRLSLFSSFEQAQGPQPQLDIDEQDTTIYDIAKAVRLIVKANPNMMELLWLPSYRYRSPEFALIQDYRQAFLSKQCAWTYIGYANSQISKMDRIGADVTGRRRDLYREHGFDTKSAMHSVRLLRQGVEIFEQNKLNVFRHDAHELLEIRRGKWKLSEVKNEAFSLMDKVNRLEKTSRLPDEPCYDEIDEMVTTTIRNYDMMHGELY